nr:ABC transporter permease [Candidatus Prometheoarchaeum syntrophicum]QEE17810.1 FtsX-like permease family protein [Candidatus Prometheoarchaeum syntrophicum]
MSNLLGFYLNQTRRGIKRSYIVIFSIGLALSMVWAVNFTIEGGLSERFPTEFSNAEDFIIQTRQVGNVSNAEIVQEISTLNETLRDTPEEECKNGLEYNSYSFLDLKIDGGSFGARPDATRIIERYNFLKANVHFLIYEPSYFSSYRFQALFNILEGVYPSSPDEVLVPYLFKEFFFYQLGDTLDMDFFLGDILLRSADMYPINNSITFGLEGDYQIFRLNGSTIAGFYAPKIEDITLLGYEYNFYATDQTFLQSTGYDWRITEFYQTPLFFSSDFSDDDLDVHPVIDLYSQLNQNETFYELLVDNVWSPSLSFTNDLIHFGNCIEIDRAFLIHDKTIQLKNQILDLDNILTNNLALDYIVFNRMSSELSEIMDQQSRTRFLSLLINIPVMIFSLFISIMNIRASESSRISDLFQLSIKGMTKKQIKEQLGFEIVFVGIFSSIIGFILGAGFFFFIRSSLSPIFFPTLTPKQIPLIISPIWVGITILIGVIISFFSYKPTLKIIKYTEVGDMAEAIETKDLQAIYNEKTTYENLTPQIQRKKPLEKHNNKNKKKKDQYEDSIVNTEKKIPKWSYLLVPTILIPIFLFVSANYAIDHPVGQFWIDLVGNMYYDFRTYLVIVLGGTILLSVYGLYRFFIVESPRRMAKLTKFLSKPLTRRLDYIFGLEMVRRREFRYIILLVSIFTSLSVMINPITVSLQSYPILVENLNVGGDIKVEVEFDQGGIQDYNFFPQFKIDLQTNISQKLNTQIGDNTYVMSQNPEFYYQGEEEEIVHPTSYYLNFPEYLTTISSKNKILPDDEISQSLEVTIEYNEHAEKDQVGLILSHYFSYYDDVSQYENFYLNFSYFNHITEKIESKWLECEVIARVNYMPGLYNHYSRYNSGSNLFLDISQVLPPNCTVYSLKHTYLLNLEHQTEIPLDFAQDLKMKIQNYAKFSSVYLYNYEWLEYSRGFVILKTKMGYSLYSLLVIGLILGIGQGLIFTQTSKANNQFHGNLMVRGVAKKQIFKFGCTQLGLFIGFAIVFSITSAVIPLISALRFSQITFMFEHYAYMGSPFTIQYPIFVNWGILFGNIIMIALSGLIIYSIFFFSQNREKYFITMKEL